MSAVQSVVSQKRAAGYEHETEEIMESSSWKARTLSTSFSHRTCLRKAFLSDFFPSMFLSLTNRRTSPKPKIQLLQRDERPDQSVSTLFICCFILSAMTSMLVGRFLRFDSCRFLLLHGTNIVPPLEVSSREENIVSLVDTLDITFAIGCLEKVYIAALERKMIPAAGGVRFRQKTKHKLANGLPSSVLLISSFFM